MRVIAGKARSLRLKAPVGIDTRPTTDRIKETLFNMIQYRVPQSIFVDLFAGSGAIGIEALSRGASHAYFLENQKDAIACIQENLSFTKTMQDATLIKSDVISGLSQIHEKEADIIFADPPYALGIEKSLFAELYHMPYVTEHTTIILEAEIHHSFEFLEDMGFQIKKVKNYKTNKHLFIERKP